MRYLPCPNCDCRNNAEAKFCNECGAQLRLKPCQNCGYRPLVVADRCDGCGIRRPEESLLETDPPNELPVLKDRLPEESYLDVPMLRDMWPKAARPVEHATGDSAKPVAPVPNGVAMPVDPLPISSAVTTVVSTETALSSSVTVDSAQPINQRKRLRMAVLLAIFGVVAIGLIVLFQGANTPAQSSVSAGALPNQTSISKPTAGNIDRVILPAETSSIAAPTSAPAAAAVPASASAPTATPTPTPTPTVTQRAGECSAALVALSLCSDSSPKQETRP